MEKCLNEGRYSVEGILSADNEKEKISAFDNENQGAVLIERWFKSELKKYEMKTVLADILFLEKLPDTFADKVTDKFEDGEAIYLVKRSFTGTTLSQKADMMIYFSERRAVMYALDLCNMFGSLFNFKLYNIHEVISPDNLIMTDDGRLIYTGKIRRSPADDYIQKAANNDFSSVYVNGEDFVTEHDEIYAICAFMLYIIFGKACEPEYTDLLSGISKPLKKLIKKYASPNERRHNTIKEFTMDLISTMKSV